MKLTFSPSVPHGVVSAPPSKSLAHRLLFGAALAPGKSTVSFFADASAPARRDGNLPSAENARRDGNLPSAYLLSQDLLATLDCLSALGALVQSACTKAFPLRGRWHPASPASRMTDEVSPPTTVSVRGFDPFSARPATLPCRESASTLRFLLPLCLLSGQECTLTGSPRLLARPLSVYESLFRERGLYFAKTDTAVTVRGPLAPGRFSVPGDVSSQFVSGLLFALPLLAGDSTLRLLPPVESRPYIDLTLAALAAFGVRIDKKSEDLYEIPGNQVYQSGTFVVEGDWSNAAPFLALAALGNAVEVCGLDPASRQGDRVCPAHLAALRQGFAEIDLADCPDLGPVLFAAAAALHGGRFTGIRRLRDKESDRVAAMEAELGKLGVRITVAENELTVHPAVLHAPQEPLLAHNDHRVAMALSVLLTQTGGVLEGAEAVEKSYPGFFDDLRRLGIHLS